MAAKASGASIRQNIFMGRRLKLNWHPELYLELRAGGERNFGWSAAHKAIPVPLLPSGPGGVRGTLSHRARSSTLRQPRAPQNSRDATAMQKFSTGEGCQLSRGGVANQCAAECAARNATEILTSKTWARIASRFSARVLRQAVFLRGGECPGLRAICVLRVNPSRNRGILRARFARTLVSDGVPPPSTRLAPQRKVGSAAPADRIAASPQCLPTTRGYRAFQHARRRNHP